MEAVLDDPRTAPIDDKLRATLVFLEKLTLHPGEITADDAAGVRKAGVSDDAIRDAIHVCFVFNIIDRVADALDFALIPDERREMAAPMMLHAGYKIV